MSLILCLETSALSCSISLSKSGKCIKEQIINEQFSHSRFLTVMIEKLLKEENLKVQDFDAIAVSSGPGSYTGLRIGASVAKGLCYGASIPLIAINTFDIMAESVRMGNKTESNWYICPAIDARRMEVYTTVFDHQGKEIMAPEAMIIDISSYRNILENHIVLFVGSGAKKIKETIDHKNARFLINELVFSASNMCLEAFKRLDNQLFEDVAYYTPFYLKPVFITSPKIIK